MMFVCWLKKKKKEEVKRSIIHKHAYTCGKINKNGSFSFGLFGSFFLFMFCRKYNVQLYSSATTTTITSSIVVVGYLLRTYL